MSVHGSLAGQSWSLFQGTSSPSHSPRPPSLLSSIKYSSNEDVMKLPAKDMHIFGICPMQDDFLLVVCEICGKRIKLEAFESHHVSRHGSQRQKDERQAMLNGKAYTVDLIREDLFNLKTIDNNQHHPSSISSSLPPEKTNSLTLKIKADKSKGIQESMEVDEHVPNQQNSANNNNNNNNNNSSSIENLNSVVVASSSSDACFVKLEQQQQQQQQQQDVVEEADSTSNNVISIPDNEPIPVGMSLDIMAMVENTESNSLVLPQSVDSTSTLLPPPPPPPLSLPPPHPPQQQQQQQAPAPPSPAPLLAPTSLPLLTDNGVKPSPSKKSRGERRPNARDREYHPDKHCGVWDNDGKKHCTRALTCKSHSVLLKRKISGRSKSFDELVAEHKAVKEAQATPTNSNCSSSSSKVASNPITSIAVAAAASTGSTTSTTTTTTGTTTTTATITTTTSTVTRTDSFPNRTSSPPEENLHYTTDHPKPLAVCTFGSRRMSGMLMTNRSGLLARKVVRVAISAGYHRINGTSTNGSLLCNRFMKQQRTTTISPSVMRNQYLRSSESPTTQLLHLQATTAPFVVNGGAATSSKMTTSGQQGQQRPGVKLNTLQQPNIVIQESFKADFSGIQFEFGKS